MGVLQWIENNFSVFIVIAFLAGLAFPGQAEGIYPLMTYVLIGIMYFTILKMDDWDLTGTVSRPAYILALTAIVLVVTPVLFYYLSVAFYEEVAPAALIIGALPAAVASSSITDLLKGKVNVALIVTVVTSLLAPFTMPFLIQAFIGVETDADVLEMLIMLAKVIFVPFALAVVSKRAFPRAVERAKPYYSAMNIALLFLTVFGPIGKNSSYILENLDKTISVSLYLMALGALLHVTGWYVSFNRSLEYKVASTVVVFYNNITLGIVFASSFFSPIVTLTVVLYNVPWCLMLLPFQYLLKKKRRG